MTVHRVMHVITGTRIGGAERLLLDVVRRLDPGEYESLTVVLDDAGGPLGTAMRDAGLEIRGLATWRRNPWGCARALARVVDDWRPDLLHSHMHHANIPARMVARSRPSLSVVSTCHVLEQRFRPWHYWQDRWTARHCFAEVCVSRAVMENQVARTGLPRDFFRLIYNGIDLDRFRRASPGGDSLTVVGVGQLRPRQKGFDVLLRAWGRVTKEVPEARLRVLGEGPERGTLEHLARGLPDGGASVSLPGQSADVPGELARASIFCMPSRWEGLPLAGMEGMAAGLPVVGSSIAPLQELMEDGVQGRLVPVEDEAALADALVDLLRRPELRTRMGEAAYQRARERFGIQRMVAQTVELYREALSRRQGAPAPAR